MDSNGKSAEPIPHRQCRSPQEIIRETGRDWKDSTSDEPFEAIEHLRQAAYPKYSLHHPIQKIMSIRNIHDEPESA